MSTYPATSQESVSRGLVLAVGAKDAQRVSGGLTLSPTLGAGLPVMVNGNNTQATR